MYEDLEPIANLRFGEAVERISQEGQKRLSAIIADLSARGLANSGPMISAKLNSVLETSEETCRALYNIWLNLILQRNQGKISREDADFIKRKVEACTETRAKQIAQVLTTGQAPAPEWALQQGEIKIQSVARGIAQELEIKLREQEAFPQKEVRTADEPEDHRFARLPLKKRGRAFRRTIADHIPWLEQSWSRTEMC